MLELAKLVAMRFRRSTNAAVVTIAGTAASLIIYTQLRQDIDESSFFVKQTLFNIAQAMSDFPAPKVCSRITGSMLQLKGYADIQFTIKNAAGNTAQVSAAAHREKLDWRTDKLSVTVDGTVHKIC